MYIHFTLDSPVSLSEGVIQDSSWWNTAKAAFLTGVQSGVDALLDHNEDQLGLVGGERLEASDHLWYLVLLHQLQLAVRHTVPIHHYLLWQGVIYLCRTDNVPVLRLKL